MSAKVYLQESKEFQLKVDVEKVLATAERRPGATDEAIFDRVTQTLNAVIEGLGGTGSIRNNLWRRAGIRYDTVDDGLKKHHLTLAIEAADRMTKLKCKQHHLVPELLFETAQKSFAYPDIRVSSRYREHDSTLKLEQDIHLNNSKYCASGSLYVKGRQTEVTNLGFFSRYFPRLKRLFGDNPSLRRVKRWDEAIFDAMTTRWRSRKNPSWMLVNRWLAGTDTLDESELSFKVTKPMEADWDYRALRDAAELYLALEQTGLFLPQPPIFTFGNPVSAIDIELAKKR